MRYFNTKTLIWYTKISYNHLLFSLLLPDLIIMMTISVITLYYIYIA